MKKFNYDQHFESLLKDAEYGYQRAVQSREKDQIFLWMDRLNKIEEQALIHKHKENDMKINKNYHNKMDSQEICPIESRRQYLISQLEYLTGKSLQVILKTSRPE